MNRTKHFGLSLLALLCCIVVTAQTTAVTECEYWIDQQFDSRQTANMSAGELTTQFNMSALPLGLHSLALRTRTGDGRWSPVLVKYFLVPQPGSTQENNLAGYEYWIDGNYNNKVTGTFSASGIITTDLDMSSLPVGLHSISFRALDDNGHVSSVLVKYFLVPQPGSTQENNLAGYEYWIDGNYDNKVAGTFSAGGIITTDLDMSSLPVGLHSISFRALDDNGHVSSVLVKYFLVPENTSTTENSIAGYRYWFDREMENIVEGEVTSSGTIVSDIDVSALSAGLHFFNYQVKDAMGKYSATMVSFFTVPEQGALVGDKIVAYDYWFNNNPRKRIEVAPTATLELSDIVLDVEGVEPETVPADYVFNSETKQVVFTFDVEFGLQVFNNQGTGSEAVTQIVKGYEFTVDPAYVALDNEVSDTKDAPQGGQVQGFSFEGAVGDSLHWEFSGPDVKIDFYDADGNRLTPETKTIDEKDVLIIKMPTTAVYALTYGATTAGEIIVKVSVKIALKPGDVNGDGLVNVTDIVATVNYIMEKPSDNFNKDAADLNGDGQINVTDIVKMVSIIMNGNGGSSRRAAATSSHLVINRNNIQLKNAEAYTAAQFDINLSDGQSINNVVLNVSSDHSLYWKMVDANTYRVVVYSMTNAAFRANSDNLFTVFMTGSQNATISNELLIKADGTTGIDAIRTEIENGNVYDLNGRQVKIPRKGVYIINGRKVVVK